MSLSLQDIDYIKYIETGSTVGSALKELFGDYVVALCLAVHRQGGPDRHLLQVFMCDKDNHAPKMCISWFMCWPGQTLRSRGAWCQETGGLYSGRGGDESWAGRPVVCLDISLEAVLGHAAG